MKCNLASLPLAMVLFTLFAQTIASQGAGEPKKETAYTDRLERAIIFRQPLIWVGDKAPSEAESEDLWLAFGFDQHKQVLEAADALESFIQRNHNSPWTPALRTLLANEYVNSGRYTPALAHWEAAWDATKALSGNGRQVADYTLAHWSRILTSLGRVDTVSALFQESKNRAVGGSPWGVMLRESKEAYASMTQHPETLMGCGGYALVQVAHSLKKNDINLKSLLHSPTPLRGYSLQAIHDTGMGYGLDLTPVQRQSGRELVVPSVVHLLQNHYVTLLEQQGDRYRVADPVLGPAKWWKADTINAEGSGYFLVPRDRVPGSWKQLNTDEAGRIMGQGFPQYISNEANTPPCLTCPCPPGGPTGSGPYAEDEECEGCGDDSGPGGMPYWVVFEPFINLWVMDEPLAYQPATGTRVSLELFYKQRSERVFATNSSTNNWGYPVFGFGPNWNCSWFSCLEADNYVLPNVTVYVAGGGTRTYSSEGTLEYQTSSRIQVNTDGNGQVTNYVVVYPSGAQEVYGFLRINAYNSLHDAFLSQKIDRRGRTTRFIYEASTNQTVRLLYVVDADGKTNTVGYASNHPASINLISQVTDPYGRTAYFNYDTNGWLTNIMDVASLSSSFGYQTNDPNHWLTRLTTPYGNATFQHTDFALDSTNPIQRAILITEPDNSHQMAVYRGDSSEFIPADPTWDTSNMPAEGFPPGSSFYNGYMNYRNSFYWGRNQFGHLSSNFTNALDLHQLVASDYAKARLRHWNHDTTTSLGGSLSMEQTPSPDEAQGAVPGKMTWYDHGYNSSSFSQGQGVSAIPLGILQVMPDGTAWYERYPMDQWGHRTNVVSTYDSGAGLASRTNAYVYADNGVDLALVYGPDGVRQAGLAYNDYHQVLWLTNALSEVTGFTYNGNRQLTGIRYPSGLVVTNVYDADGWLRTNYSYAVSGGGAAYYGTNSYTYLHGLVRTHIDARGLTTTLTWDNLQRLTQVDYPDATSVSLTYTNLDLVRVVDRLGYSHSFGYNKVRQKVVETNALGVVTTYAYCECGGLEYVTNAVGTAAEQVTHYVYDNQGNRTHLFYPGGYSVTNQYDSVRRLTNATDTANARISWQYNVQGLVTNVNNRAGPVARYSYDINDRETGNTDANGVTVRQTFDNLGRLLTRTYPDGGEEQWAYTFNIAAATGYTDPLTNIINYAYDPLGRLTHKMHGSTSQALFTNSFGYTAAGDLATLTDGRGMTTQWHFDPYGRATNKVDALSREVFRYQYDADGRLTSQWSLGKGTTSLGYNAVGNLLTITYPINPQISMSYDALNRLTNRVDALGTTRYTYSTNGLLASEDGPWDNDTVSYSYTNRMRDSLTLQQPGGSAWTNRYGYDLAKRLTQITSPAGAFGYAYYTGSNGAAAASGLIQNLSLPNGAAISHAYDNVARKVGTYLNNSQWQSLNYHTYSYNKAGRRERQTRSNQGVLTWVDYSYDAAGQLKTASGKNSNEQPLLNQQMGYGYDPSGNLHTRTNQDLTQTFNGNEANQLTSLTRSDTLTVSGTYQGGSVYQVKVNGQNATLNADHTFAAPGMVATNGINIYTAIAYDSTGQTATNTVTVNLPAVVYLPYDANGNLTGDGRRSFYYDDENQLTSVLVASEWKAEFAYDGVGRRRITKDYSWNAGYWSLTNEVHYIYDGNLVIQERDGNNQPIATYTKGLDLSGSLEGAGGIGGLLARSQDYSSGNWSTHHFYQADGNGNLTFLLNSSQTKAGSYEYDPYGYLIVSEGSMADTNLYRFSSKEFHVNSGLYYFRGRYYDPNLERFINQDPIGEDGGINLYEFAANDAVNSIDPFGNQVLVEPPPGAIFYPDDFIGPLPFNSYYESHDFGGPYILPEKWRSKMRNLLFPKPPLGMKYGICPMPGSFGRPQVSNLLKVKAIAGTTKGTPLLKVPSTTRLPQDIAVNPNAPAALPLNRPISGIPQQQQALGADIQYAFSQGATDIRVNQQQVNALGQRVGVNKPDLQYTLPGDKRVYIEYDNTIPSTWPNTPRGPGHGARILANDPNGVYIQRSF